MICLIISHLIILWLGIILFATILRENFYSETQKIFTEFVISFNVILSAVMIGMSTSKYTYISGKPHLAKSLCTWIFISVIFDISNIILICKDLKDSIGFHSLYLFFLIYSLLISIFLIKYIRGFNSLKIAPCKIGMFLARKKFDLKDPAGLLDNCSICLEIFGEDEIVKLECTHIFHEKCLEEWLKIQKNCPLCKAILSI